MSPHPERRPLKEGFLSLLPAEALIEVRSHLKEIERLAREARQAGEHSRQGALDAIWEEEQGFLDRAKRDRASAEVDHRRAADHLMQLCLAVRALVAYAALDWRPTLDVVGSGLTQPELFVVCSVMGRPIEGEVSE